MKGNFILHSPSNEEKKLKSVLPSKETTGVAYMHKIQDLVHEHYGVKIKEEEIFACHPTSGGGALLKLGKRSPGSSFSKLVEAVKSGGIAGKTWREKQEGKGKQEGNPSPPTNPNFFITFQLTQRRSQVVKKLKALKKEKRIAKFYTNENGDICFKKTHSSEKKYITFSWRFVDSKTYSEQEIEELINTK